MISFPNAKINLGLRITRKRDDGYHDLDTVFYPIPLCDALEIVWADTTRLHCTGLGVDNSYENNLVWKAYVLLKNDFPSIPDMDMYLHKVIPMGAGLGGGSADATFALQLINEMAELKLSRSELHSYALKLGSDCPFFLINTPSYGTSRGEKLDPIFLDLKKYYFLIIKPSQHISTAKAFSMIRPQPVSLSTKEIVAKPIEHWKDELINDFEFPAFEQFPELLFIKQELYRMGALYASMSGSGSSFFGIFEQEPELGSGLQTYQNVIIPPIDSLVG